MNLYLIGWFTNTEEPVPFQEGVSLAKANNLHEAMKLIKQDRLRELKNLAGSFVGSNTNELDIDAIRVDENAIHEITMDKLEDSIPTVIGSVEW